MLTTISSEYGVEAVCFNEILANEGSKIRRPYDVHNYLTGDRADTRVHNIAYIYGDVEYREDTYGRDLQSTNIVERERFFRDGEVAFPILTNRTESDVQGVKVMLRDYPLIAEGYYNAFTDFRSLLQSRGGGYTSGVRINWPENIWANCYMAVFDKRPATNADRFPRKVFSIRRSTTDNVLYLDAKGVSAEDLEKLKNGGYLYAQLRGWVWDKALYAELPSVSTWLVCQGLDPQKYYRVFIHETNLETPTDDKVGGHQYSKYLDVDGTLARSSRQECRRLRYRYDDGTAKRPDQRGCMDIYLTSTSECQPLARNRVNAIYFARPDIIELINISDRPISIRNWSLVANTGSLAYELGAIDKAIGYSREFGGRTADPNPVIRPGEYFYLCNNAEIFDFEHGSPRNGSWGSSLNEAMPLYEIDDDTWGVRFQIRSVSESRGANNQWISRVTCGNESWKRDQFLNEVAEFQTTRASTSRSVSPDGVRYQINGGNTRNTLIFDTFKLKEYSDIQPGDYVMIVGMPRVGGFLSLTLKNEYGQIASRVLEYGNPGADATRNPDRWIGWSAEKLDPTHESWTLTSKPTIGGSVARARNHTLPSGKYAAPHVKNGPFASIGEIQQVRTGKDWENVGGGKAGSTTILRGTADYFDTAALRLDASAEGAHVAGWHPAFGECSQSDRRNLVDNAANWENAIWNNQSLAILSGDCRGEVFPVVSSGRSSLHVVGRSVPRRIEFSVRKGDRYAVGPGYSSAMYYTRREGDEGEWEWSRQRIPKGSYELFLSGLNDSIITTEFLEENRNAKLDVFLYNYSTRMYDQIGSGRQYDKSDVCVAGTVSPEHISGGGALRLKLVARGLQGERSGFAWFNCAFLTPVPVEGRININTAPPRILMCLNGVDQSLAANIFRGIDSQGRAILKPYQSIADLLRVRGMSPAIFGPIVNLVTIRSDQYTVHAVGQRVLDRDRDGEFSSDAGDKVLATTRLRVLFDRTPVIEQPNGENGAAIRILERERL